MTGIWFYHLERSPLDAVLPTLLTKTLEKGWRAVVRAGTQERLRALDGHLWTFTDESFLPHGLSGQPHEADQPILLTTHAARPNGAQALFLVEGADFPELDQGKDGFDGLERCFVIFNGHDDAALGEARAAWKRLKDVGLALSYWQQNDGGGWDKKAST